MIGGGHERFRTKRVSDHGCSVIYRGYLLLHTDFLLVGQDKKLTVLP